MYGKSINQNQNRKFDMVIYHRNCNDGFAGFYLFYKTKLFNKLQVYPDVPSTTKVPPNIANKNIIIIDVAYNKNIAEQIVKNAKYVLFIDHHITTINAWNTLKQTYNNKLDIFYNIDKSGASLTYQYFYNIINKRMHLNFVGNTSDINNIINTPRFLKYIENNDIGKWDDMNVVYFVTSLEVDYLLEPTKTNIKNWDKLWDNKIVDELIKNGKMYYKYKNFLLDKISRNYIVQNNVIYVNVPAFVGGDIANYLVKNNLHIDYVVAWHYIYQKNIYIVQLRSHKYNVSEIAKKYGGGGHINASVFSTTTHPHQLFNISHK